MTTMADFESVPKMNTEVKEKWIKALRSGEYKQAQGKLRDNNNGFCCLGVLCDVYAKENPQAGWKQPDVARDYEVFFFDEKSFNMFSGFPDSRVMDWAGLPNVDPLTNEARTDFETRMNAKITDLNDKMNYDFNRIADVIERDF